MRLPSLFAFIALVSVVSANAAWLRLPALDKKSTGMELAYAGTALHSSEGIEDAASLIMGDLKKSAKVPHGRSEAVLMLARQSYLKTVSFIGNGLEGKVFLFSSPDARTWTSLAEAELSTKAPLTALDVGRAQGKYIKLMFELSAGGGLRGVQLFGSDSDANYVVAQKEGAGTLLNFATGIGGGRLIYLSDNAPGVAKDALQTNHLTFSAKQQWHTAVYDLGQERALREFGSIHSERRAKLSVYALTELPERETWRGRTGFDPAVLDAATPVATGSDGSGVGHVTIRPAAEVKTRYVVLRWETEAGAPGFEVYGVTISGMANVFFQDAQITATTFCDANGNVVTKLKSHGGNSSEAESAGELVAGHLPEEWARSPLSFGAYDGGLGAGLMYSSFYKGGGGGPMGGGRRKEEGEAGDEIDPDEDPPAVHIIWCEEASP